MNAIRPFLIGVSFSLPFIAAEAQVAPEKNLNLEIRSQILRDALNDWAQQTGYQIVFQSSDVTSKLVVPSIKGSLSPARALQQLLENTPLVFEWLNERTVVIRERAKPLYRSTVWQTLPGDSPPPQVAYAAEQTAPAAAPAADQRAVSRPAEPADGRRDIQRGSLEEIIVTAQKREERLRDVPISISVVGGIELDKSTVQGVTEALNRVPGVSTNVSFQGGGTQVTIRGVTAATALAAGSSPVAYYLDSAPFGFVTYAIAPDANAYDMERVEVLRGPQGTLYGASALNGVVRVLTKDADLDSLELKARGALSSTKDGGDNYRGDMAVNLPIIDGKLAARAVVGFQDLSGWIDRPNRKDANDGRVSNYRLRVKAQPTDELSIGLSGWLSRSEYDAPPTGTKEMTHRSSVDEPIENNYDVFSLKVGYDFSRVSLTSMSSYIDYSSDSMLDQSIIGDTKLDTNLGSKVFAQELVLNSSQDTQWRWSVGGIYRDAEDAVFQLRPPPRYAAPTDQRIASESYAVFGELTRLFLDGRLQLTGGLRYFEDEVTSDEYSRSTAILPPSQLVHTRATFDALSPRVVLTWRPQADMTMYASYSEGFRSGAHQQPAVIAVAPDLPPVDADTLTNYEIGAKTSFLDGRVVLDAAVYYIDWQDVQQSLTVRISSSGTFNTALVNGHSASGLGAEFGLTLSPLDGLAVSTTFAWNDLTMDDQVFSRGIALFEKGDRLNYSPEYTAGAAIDYSFALGPLDATFSIGGNYTSEQTNRTIFNGVSIGESDEMFIGRTSFAIGAGDRWTTTLFVDNVTDERGTPNTVAFRTLLPEWDVRVRPLTAGVQFELHFE